MAKRQLREPGVDLQTAATADCMTREAPEKGSISCECPPDAKRVCSESTNGEHPRSLPLCTDGHSEPSDPSYAGVKRAVCQPAVVQDGGGDATERVVDGDSDERLDDQDDLPRRQPQRRRRVNFRGVTLYYFDRSQGFICVPTAGGHTIGMTERHSEVKKMSLAEHGAYVRSQQRAKAMERDASLRDVAMSVDGCAPVMSALCDEASTSGDSSSEEGGEVPPVADQTDPPTTGVAVDSAVGEAAAQPQPGVSSQHAHQHATVHAHAHAHSPVGDGRTDEFHHMSAAGHDDVDEDGDDDYEYYLQPLSVRQRKVLLQSSGVRLDATERGDCQKIRQSRMECGCRCAGARCVPETCACARDGIKCQVDRPSFPCACDKADNCGNPAGRVEFNPSRVRLHYINTMNRLRLQAQLGEEIPSPSLRRVRFVPDVNSYCDDVPEVSEDQCAFAGPSSSSECTAQLQQLRPAALPPSDNCPAAISDAQLPNLPDASLECSSSADSGLGDELAAACWSTRPTAAVGAAAGHCQPVGVEIVTTGACQSGAFEVSAGPPTYSLSSLYSHQPARPAAPPPSLAGSYAPTDIEELERSFFVEQPDNSGADDDASVPGKSGDVVSSSVDSDGAPPRRLEVEPPAVTANDAT